MEGIGGCMESPKSPPSSECSRCIGAADAMVIVVVMEKKYTTQVDFS
jgi:hypothetical protein